MSSTPQRGIRPGPGQAFAAPARASVVAALVAAWTVGAAGCDLPLDPPVWTTDWTVDLVRDERSVLDFLPPGVRVDGDGFAIDPVRSASEVRLADVCEACTCFSGPVPALDIAPIDWGLPLPGGLSAAELSAGEARLTLRNGVGFDLLRRPDGVFGSLLVQLVDTRSGAVLDSVRVVQSFPPGDSLTVDFGLDGLELHQNLVARASARIPGSGCDSVSLANGPTIGADVSVAGARADGVFVLLSDQSVRAPSRSVDLPDWLAGRLRPGDARIRLEVEATSTLAAEVEIELSVAGSDEQLFGSGAALVTPFRVMPGGPDAPVISSRPFVIDVAALTDADRLAIATRSRVLGNRRVRLTGPEAISYRARLFAEIPSR